MEEQTFFNEDGVTVTNARFISGGQTHAMSGVTAVRAVKSNPSRKGPIALILISVILLMGSSEISVAPGLIVLAGGVAWWILHKPTYIVLMSSASGEVNALSSKSEQFVDKVVAAVNDAIVSRG